MNILHIYKDYYPVLGGIENHIRLLAEAQAAQGHEVTVLVTNPNRNTIRIEQNGVHVIKAGRLAAIASTPLSLALPRLLRHLHADIAHLHAPYPVGELANYLLRPARRTVITYHSDVVRQKDILRLYAPFLRRVLRAADCIIATSPPYIESSPFLRRVSDRCVVIPLGVDVNRFRQADEAKVAAICARYPAPRLLFVGRLRYYKGLSYLLQAMPHLPETHLLIVGSGPMEATWHEEAESLGLTERAHFLGEVEDADLPAFHQAADIFVLPASERSEAFGAVLIEAMAAGLPCISTELGTGTSYVNLDGETGRVVPPRDAAALAEAIDQMWTDPVGWRAMAEKSAKRSSEFSLKKMVERIMDLYQRLLS